VSAAAQKVLGDSITAVTRLAFQIEQERDRLDQALKIQRTAIAGIRVEIASLRTAITSKAPVIESTEGVRSASFTVKEPPFRGSVDVSLPKPPAAGSLKLGISIDPAPIGLRLGCLDARSGDNGIRRATAVLTGPVWLKATIDSVSQSPEICNPGRVVRSRSIKTPLIVGAVAGGVSVKLVEALVDRIRGNGRQ
jgi:hypothetical protein